MMLEVATLAAVLTDLATSVFALFLAGSCRSKCCAGKVLDIAHEEKGDKLDVSMSDNAKCDACSQRASPTMPAPIEKDEFTPNFPDFLMQK